MSTEPPHPGPFNPHRGARLHSLVTADPGQPVFVTGGPPRVPFSGSGVAHWRNPAFALHHARSWGSMLTLTTMMPLAIAAKPGSSAFERFVTRERESLGVLAGQSPPPIAQVWGPLTLASTQVGLEELLRLLHSGADVAAVMANGLAASRAATHVALQAGAPVVWVAEPLPVLVDPDTLARTWVSPMRSLIAQVRAAHADPVVHMSGAAGHVLPFIGTIGAAGVSITADTPLEAAREALDESIVVFGNLDSMRLLDRDPAWLAEQARAMVAGMSGRPFVVTPGSALPDRMSVTPLETFIDAARMAGTSSGLTGG